MSKIHEDISDDEIRIISSANLYCSNPEQTQCEDDKCLSFNRGEIIKPKPYDGNSPNEPDKKPKKYWLYIVIALCIILVGAVIYSLVKSDQDDTIILVTNSEKAVGDTIGVTQISDSIIIESRGAVEITDTTINGISLTIFTPGNATPQLHIGADALRDSSAIFVVQAADVRGDNGEIVGTYVHEGKLISKGQSKSGFCAIIGGSPIIGVADSTPYLEQAIESGGYFFRQYPLVVGNQLVENKIKSPSLRKALAELNGKVVVIMSQKRVTMHDFAQALVDLGVSNAIYMVGSSAYGFAIDAKGNKIEFGKEDTNARTNTNYIVWK